MADADRRTLLEYSDLLTDAEFEALTGAGGIMAAGGHATYRAAVRAALWCYATHLQLHLSLDVFRPPGVPMPRIPSAVAIRVRQREGRRCRACARERDAATLSLFPLREVVTADDAIQVCEDCRAAESRRDLGMSGHGDGVVVMHGAGPVRTGVWRTKCRLA